jgi:hypothetical protein
MPSELSLHAHMLCLPSGRAVAGDGARASHGKALSPEEKGRRIWELNSNFHCSIIGTCLTTRELRQLLTKMGLAGVERQTDHELHGQAVLLAGKRDQAAKLLHKALDRLHRQALNRFRKATSVEDLRGLWRDAVRRAEIPGAYWAVLTHPLAAEELVREAFGEVHVLSHLVGAANRADIRQLRELEADNAALQDKLARQQRHLQDAIVSRDATIAGLRDALGEAIASRPDAPSASGYRDDSAAAGVIQDLQRRLARDAEVHTRLELRLRRLQAEFERETKLRAAAEARALEIQAELESAEFALAKPLLHDGIGKAPSIDLGGMSILYVGGRPHNLAVLRAHAEDCSASFLHHDGGVDDRSGLLASLTARADMVFLPVDCVSHNAVAVVKRVGRQLGKPYAALRTSGLTSFVVALRRVAERGRSEAPQDFCGRVAEHTWRLPVLRLQLAVAGCGGRSCRAGAPNCPSTPTNSSG